MIALSKNNDKTMLRSVVPIKITGSRAPLFLIHSSSLDVALFKPFADLFDEEQPFYGIQAIGMDDTTTIPPSTIEEIAKVYKAEIESVNSTGPYCLAGYSDGGLIAYEIAMRMIEEKKDVKFFAVVDTNASRYAHPKNKFDHLIKKVARQFNKVPFFIRQFFAYPKDSFDYQFLALKRRFARVLPAQAIPELDPYSVRQKELRAVYNNAVSNYLLKPFGIAVSVFSVKKRLYYVDEPRHLGWKKLALKGCKIYKIPGDHKTFQFPPNNKRFIQMLQKVMNSKF